jgi:hypothetical protein
MYYNFFGIAKKEMDTLFSSSALFFKVFLRRCIFMDFIQHDFSIAFQGALKNQVLFKVFKDCCESGFKNLFAYFGNKYMSKQYKFCEALSK